MNAPPIGPATVLVAIPTYNEKDNILPLLELFRGVPGDFHILYVDDNSPDGTAAEVERAQADWPNLMLMRRAGKLGLGTAHRDAIHYAYAKGYQRLITMDADLTHDPRVLPRFLELSDQCDVVVGSRHLLPDSLPGWNFYRRSMTWFGHFLTTFFLKMPYDATGALRLYNLHTVPQGIFRMVRSTGYSFLYESLFILWNNGCRVAEVPIELPARTYGSSKMSLHQVLVSAFRLGLLYSNVRLAPDLYRNKNLTVSEASPTATNWDRYWGGALREGASDLVFEVCATWFRALFNKPFLERIMARFFRPGERVLHAGCGSGQVDQRLRHWLEVSACDISADAVRMYDQLHLPYCRAEVADITALPYAENEFDGVYNLGVMEHFTEEEILLAFRECYRVLRPGGRIVIFWPPLNSPIRHVLKIFQWVSSRLDRSVKEPPYPPEISRVTSRAQGENWLKSVGFRPIYCEFSFRDLFTQFVFVAEK